MTVLSRDRPFARSLVAAVLMLALAAGCTRDRASDRGGEGSLSTTVPEQDPRAPESGRFKVDEPAAMAVGPDGSLYVGERRSGRIVRVPADQVGRERPVADEVARVDVATEGQQGLLGLAVLPDGTLVAGASVPGPPARQSLVRFPAGGGPAEVVWSGPMVVEQAIGGRVAVAPDGRVVMGLGSFERDPVEAPYGSLLSLDPAGPATQDPVAVSSGWNNPFAFAFSPDGRLWVADNSPGDVAERIGRGDGAGPVTELEGVRAPSGLAVPAADRLVVCGYVSERLEEFTVAADGTVGEGRTLAPCRLGVVALGDGQVAVAGEGEVTIRTLP